MIPLTELFTLLFSVAAGALIGLVFFGGLWLTVQRGLQASRVALWVLISFLLRMGFALGGFYLISDGQWQRMLSCLLGFLLARTLISQFTRTRTTTEASHASES
jgi:F1F0 ATPase subunit 2